MSTFEELKTLKLKDANLSQDEFYNVIRDRIVEQAETDEVLAKGFEYDPELEFEEKIAEKINAIYDSPTYFKRATIQLAFNQALKDARYIAKQIEYSQSLVVVDDFVGCFVGGNDWTGLVDKNNTPMKQDLVFLVNEDNEDGDSEVVFRVADIFGKTPVRDWEDELKVGSWYQVELVESQGKGRNADKTYINVGTFEEVSSDGLPTLKEMLDEAKISIFDIEESDATNYKYMVVEGQIRNIAPIPVWDDDMTKPVIHMKDRESNLMYDDEGNKVMGYPQAIVGYENLQQRRLGGDGEATTMYIRLQDDEYELEDDEIDVFFEARFHNQYHGINTVNINFSDFFDYEDDDADPEELSNLISDYLQGRKIVAVVKMTSYNPDKNNDKLTWERSNGIYIEER